MPGGSKMILLSNGTVVDGSGKLGEKGSVLVCDDQIKDVGQIVPTSDMEIIDCAELTISP